jgi:hypothetical protein
MQSTATTVEQYLAELPTDRRAPMAALCVRYQRMGRTSRMLGRMLVVLCLTAFLGGW